MPRDANCQSIMVMTMGEQSSQNVEVSIINKVASYESENSN